jgi:hypothetical protein
METPDEIEITIDYELASGETGHLDLLPREYFDPAAFENEANEADEVNAANGVHEAGEADEASGKARQATLDVDSDPLHYDSAEYLDATPADLKSAKLSLFNKATERRLSYNTSYWNQGKNQITAKTEWLEGVIVEEAITFSLTTADTPTTNHIIRTVAKEGLHVPVYHRVFTAEADGEEKEDEIL